MNEDDSIRMSLLKIYWGDEETHVKPDREKNDRETSEEGNHLPSEWVKIHRRGVLVPVDFRFAHEFRVFCSSFTERQQSTSSIPQISEAPHWLPMEQTLTLKRVLLLIIIGTLAAPGH